MSDSFKLGSRTYTFEMQTQRISGLSAEESALLYDSVRRRCRVERGYDFDSMTDIVSFSFPVIKVEE